MRKEALETIAKHMRETNDKLKEHWNRMDTIVAMQNREKKRLDKLEKQYSTHTHYGLDSGKAVREAEA